MKCFDSDTHHVNRINSGGSTLYDGLCEEAPPERGTFFRRQVCERVGFHSLKYIKG